MVPLNVCFRSMERDEQVVWRIDERVAELEKQCDSIIGCEVVVYGPDTSNQKMSGHVNDLYDVRVVLSLPCREIVVERGQNPATNVWDAVENAFQAVRVEFDEWLVQRHQLHEECF